MSIPISTASRDFKPLRPISIKSHALQLHEFASALVHRGIDPQTLTSLADFVEVEAFKEGLRFFYEERTPGRYLQAHRMAVILLPVAKILGQGTARADHQAASHLPPPRYPAQGHDREEPEDAGRVRRRCGG